jgi:hypothetical protein
MSVGVLCWDLKRRMIYNKNSSGFFYRSSKLNSWKRKTQGEVSEKGGVYDIILKSDSIRKHKSSFNSFNIMC